MTTIISYNVNGIRAALKKGLADWLKQAAPDVLCIQETKATANQVDTSVFDDLGYNFIGSDISAAFAISKLRKLKSNIKARIENFQKLKKMFVEFNNFVDTFNTTKDYETGWLAFPFLLKGKYKNRRTDLQIKLEKSFIQTRTIFSGNITRQPVSKKFKWIKYGKLINSDEIMKRGILIGCHELINDKKIKYLYEKLKEFFKN